MIMSFGNATARALFEGRRPKGVPPDVARRAVTKLFLLETVTRVEDLRVPPGNRLHQLAGDRAGQWSISVNDQWRICFRWFEGNVWDVEIVDYH